jgi:CSLREA domain-containing protein
MKKYLKRPPLAIAQAMEARVLFSADFLPADLATNSFDTVPSPVQTQSQETPQNASAPISQLVVIDLGIANWQVLLQELQQQQTQARANGEHFEILTLNEGDDGIAKIATALSEQGEVTSLHLIGHGNEAMMRLGSTWLDAETTRLRASDLSTWANNLSIDADIFLYGCNFAATSEGQQIVRDLSQITGADVAASTDATGNDKSIANWKFEYTAGDIEQNRIDYGASQWQGRLASYIVTNTNDSGAGSFRQAILDANANTGQDNIDFNISAPLTFGAHTISLASALPLITGAVFINGQTEPDWNSATAQPVIELSGSAIAGLVDGLKFANETLIVRGLSIYGFSGAAISLQLATDSIISGNYIGLRANGTTTIANGQGIMVQDSLNTSVGLELLSGRNIISGNAGSGVEISGNSNNSIIINNYIGVDSTGIQQASNGANGIEISSAEITIGGLTSASRNVIAGNGTGIAAGEFANDLKILNNYIGINANNTATIGNSGYGINVWRARGVQIGDIAAGNIITGNAGGINIAGAGALANIVGNTIQYSTGSGDGIYIGEGGSTIGGTTGPQSNNISYNSGSGISINSANATTSVIGNYINNNGGAGVRINNSARFGLLSANSIHSNTGLNIELSGATVVANDILDTDIGANDFQNFPNISLALSGTNGTVLGSLSSSANQTYTLEFFKSSTLHSSTHGDARVMLGSTMVTTDNLGNASFNATVTDFAAGEWITSTARDSAGNTSQLSQSIQAVDPLLTVDTTADVLDGATTSIAALVANKGADGRISLREAITAANASVNGTAPDRIGFAIPTSDAGYNAGTGVFRINLSSALPTIQEALEINGTTQTTLIGDTNAGVIGPVGAVGTDGIALSQLSRPEIEIVVPQSVDRLFRINAADVTISGLAMYGSGLELIRIDPGADSFELENNVIGASATSWSDPGAATRTRNILISGIQADNGIIRDNLIGFSGDQGIELISSMDNWLIENNIIMRTSLNDANHDMLLHEGAGLIVRWNLFDANNSSGIEIGVGSSATLIENNTISSSTGTEGFAIRISDGSAGSMLTRNIIKSNAGAGINVASSATISILQNAISGNSGLGIDLGSFGVLANDALDVDAGANGGQNYPTITSAVQNGLNFIISGSISSAPNAVYRIEFFTSPSADPTGHGEGSDFLDYIDVSTGAAGTGSFNANFNLVIPNGTVVTATATLKTGASSFGGTSEFAQNRLSTTAAPGVTVTPPSNNLLTEGGTFTQFSVVLNTAPTSNVTINLSLSDPTEGSIGVNVLTFIFTPLNWNIAQQVTVTGVNDYLLDGGIGHSVITSNTSSADPTYNNLSVDDISFFTLDNDSFSSLIVDTTSNIVDGDVSSIEALWAYKGTDGKISLREAILTANNSANPGGTADRILFDITTPLVGGVHLIDLSGGDLPTITQAVVIDGTSEPDYAAGSNRPVVRIDGALTASDGITFGTGSEGSIVRGLMITRFSSAGVLVESNNNTVESSYIGTDGTIDLGNGGAGIYILGDGNQLGTVGAGNLVSGNNFEGISFSNTANGNVIAANRIGTNASGTAAIANTYSGIYVLTGADNNVFGLAVAGGGNLVSGNGGAGINIDGADNTTVQNNIVGLTANGQTALGNTQTGVLLTNGANNMVLGGASAYQGNTISGNVNDGIFLYGTSTSSNQILGNFIGTNTTGTVKIGNGYDGIGIAGGANSNIIGGAFVGAGNTIGGNQDHGISVEDAATTGNQILGNFIGINSSGTADVGNAQHGINFRLSVGANTVGGSTPAHSNVITNNGENGVNIPSASDISVIGNRIFANTLQGINLGTNGVTVNDVNDVDIGANGLQNFPVLQTAVLNMGNLLLTGNLTSSANTSFRVEIFSSPSGSADTSGFGEGRMFVGFFDVFIDASGQPTPFSIALTPAHVMTVGDIVTATATVKTGPSSFGATSEFSQNVLTTASPSSSISGRVFNDANTDGAIASDSAIDSSQVYLFQDDGDGIANAADTLIASTTTDSNGAYTFSALAAGTYWTVIDSRSITAALNSGQSSGDTWWEQTYGSIGAMQFNGATTYAATSGALWGGANRLTSDGFTGGPASLPLAEHVTRVVLVEAAATINIDFAFSANAIVHTRDGDDDTNAARSVQGSLRQFMQNGSALFSNESSQFRLSGNDTSYNATTGVWQFTVASSLPTLSAGTTLDGNTQRLWSGTDSNSGNYLATANLLSPYSAIAIDEPDIEIVGTGPATLSAGIVQTGASGSIRGLSIFGFSTGIYTTASGATIEGNFIGANANGASDPVTNRLNIGIAVNAAAGININNNLIAHTRDNGLSLDGATNVLITRNTISNIGLSSFEADGINLVYGANSATIFRNTIQAIYGNGIDVGAASMLLIDENLITNFGLLGAEQAGIQIREEASAITIQRNVISAGLSGIVIDENSAVDAHLIGGASAGNTLVALGGNGITLNGTHSVVIQGNKIGVTASGLEIANAGTGIIATGGAFNTMIGGANPGEGNVIAYGSSVTANGVYLPLTTTILGNSIYLNGATGVALTANRTTAAPNDVGDADLIAGTGPQNYPIITSAIANTGITTLTGTLNSQANRTYRIEVFRNSTAITETNAISEGAEFVGWFNVTTDATGSASFNQGLVVETFAGDKLTTTATEEYGSSTFGYSSEFSAAATVVAIMPGVIILPTTAMVTTENTGSAQFSVRLSTAPVNDIVLNFSVSDLTEASLSTSTITFTSLNWSIAQLITVTGLDDSFLDGAKNYKIFTTLVSNLDPNYNGLTVADLDLTNTDNDASNQISVDTTADINDGDTSSIEALYSNKGADGFVSLREAILAANNTPNGVLRDQIYFNINDALVAGAHTINLISALPAITDAVLIDGATDSDYGVAHVIELNGAGAGAASGLILNTNNSQINGLTINSFSQHGIEVAGSGNTLTSNYIGTDVTGMVARSNGGDGVVLMGAMGVTLGGAAIGLGNVISGNIGNGIVVGANSAGATIQNNLLGINASSTGAISNGIGASNIRISGSGLNNLLIGGGASLGNIFGGNSQQGIFIDTNSAPGALISFNYFGTTSSLISSLGTMTDGIIVQASGVTLHGNTIANTSHAGIVANGSASTVDITSNRIFNLPKGVAITGAAQGIRIAGNLISADLIPIDIDDDGISANDAGDVDSGPNGRQNVALLSSVTTNGSSQIQVAGSYNGQASRTLTIEVFSHGMVGINAFSQPVGSFDVTTDASGNLTFNQVLAGSYSVGSQFSLTVTDITDATNQQTSEHSAVAAASTIGITVTPVSGLVVDEAGASAMFSIALNSQPSADVVITIVANVAGEVSLSTTSLTFNNVNWNTPQLVTITGLQDFTTDGNRAVTLITTVTSTDAGYNNFDVLDIAVTNIELANTAPTITGPISYTIFEDTPVYLVSGNTGIFSGLVLTDVDAGNNLLDATVTATNGRFSFGSTLGISFNSGSGIDVVSTTFRGTVASMNAAIANIFFEPNAQFTGTAFLQMFVNDLGNSGFGGMLGNQISIPISVVAVNDVATFSGNTNVLIAEGSSVTISSANLLLADNDTATTDLVFSILNFSSEGKIQRSGIDLAVGENFTQADIDAGRISYLHLGAEQSFAWVNLSATELPGIALPNITLNIVVDPVNDAPQISAITGNTVIENSAASSPVGIVTVADEDNLTGAVFSLIDSSNGAFSIDRSTGAITVGNPLLIDFESLSQHTLRVRVTDALGASTERSFQIEVTDAIETVVVSPITPFTPISPTIPPKPQSIPDAPSVGGSSTAADNPISLAASQNDQVKRTDGEEQSSAAVLALTALGTNNDFFGRGEAKQDKRKTVWIDTSASREVIRPQTTSRVIANIELTLINADGQMLARRNIASSNLEIFLSSKKDALSKVDAPAVRIEQFKLPSIAKSGGLDINAIEESANNRQFSIVIDSIEMGGMVLSVGVVAWVARAGGLVAALVSALPAWRGLDPLMVLSPTAEDTERESQDFEDTQIREDEEAVQAVLN